MGVGSKEGIKEGDGRQVKQKWKRSLKLGKGDMGFIISLSIIRKQN